MDNRIRVSLTASALFAAFTLTASAQDELPVPADEFVYCATCHGVQLMGNAILKAPRLSGMDAWYVEQQMQSFKKGWRGAHDADLPGMEMQPMAAALTDKQISESAKFVSATRSALPAATISGDVEKGEAIYSNCGTCHGQSGEGNRELRGSQLNVTEDWYLVAQLKNYINGSRGSHPDDRYGRQMRAYAQILTDDDAIADVVSYISTLNDE